MLGEKGEDLRQRHFTAAMQLIFFMDLSFGQMALGDQAPIKTQEAGAVNTRLWSGGADFTLPGRIWHRKHILSILSD